MLILLFLLVVIILSVFVSNQLSENYTTEPVQPLQLINTFKGAMYNNKINSNFGNFGIIGDYPAIPVADNCQLDFNCTNFPYESDDKNVSVCRRCNGSIFKNYNIKGYEPLDVYARATGKPRQSRNINANSA